MLVQMDQGLLRLRRQHGFTVSFCCASLNLADGHFPGSQSWQAAVVAMVRSMDAEQPLSRHVGQKRHRVRYRIYRLSLYSSDLSSVKAGDELRLFGKVVKSSLHPSENSRFKLLMQKDL